MCLLGRLSPGVGSRASKTPSAHSIGLRGGACHSLSGGWGFGQGHTLLFDGNVKFCFFFQQVEMITEITTGQNREKN